MLTPLQGIFYIFSAVSIFSALMVIVSKNPVRAVLFLVLTFVSTAGLWILLHAEFLALILILVYVGAVMTLFLFVVMMLSVNVTKREGFVRYVPFAALIALLMSVFIIILTHSLTMPIPVRSENYNNLAELGMMLYTQYAYPFEIAGVLLLTAMIAAISLTHRANKKGKRQRIAEQITVRREDRIRLINMPSEKK